jgi:hypothetical protein
VVQGQTWLKGKKFVVNIIELNYKSILNANEFGLNSSNYHDEELSTFFFPFIPLLYLYICIYELKIQSMSSNAWFAKDLAWGLHKLLQ